MQLFNLLSENDCTLERKGSLVKQYTHDGYAIKRELWDGSRFSELSWFWDPHCEWTLPVCCPFCRAVISATTVNDVVSRCSSNSIKLQCLECHTRFDHDIRKAKGDPRNIALLGHWDGVAAIFSDWQAQFR